MIHFHHQTTFEVFTLFGDLETFSHIKVFLHAKQVHEEPALAKNVP
jgi:hypothetical protein